MEWVAMSLAVLSYIFVADMMKKNKQLEARVQELENKVQ